jgi:hypothetical protein
MEGEEGEGSLKRLLEGSWVSRSAVTRTDSAGRG